MAAPRRGLSPAAIYVIGVCWLVALGIAAVVYLKYTDRPFSDHSGIVYIAWYGALGGTTASMHGAIRWADRWHPEWTVWYVFRPVIGAVVGAIGYMIYVSIVQASFNDNVPIGPTFLGFVIAFALGYKEEAFRELLQRVFDLVAAASGADVEPPSAPPSFRAATQPGEPWSVALSWSPSDDNVGVVGYTIYRDRSYLAAVHVPPSGADRGGEEAPPIPFCDRHVEPGTYLYSVSAFDRSGNESRASGPIRVTVPHGGDPAAEVANSRE